MLSGGAPLRALLHYQSEEMKILNISFPLVGIDPRTYRVIVARICRFATTDLKP